MCSSILGGMDTEECNKIYFDCVRDFFTEDKSVFYNWFDPTRQSGLIYPLDVSQMLFGIDYVNQFVIDDDNKAKLSLNDSELSENILWVNAWDPFSMLGNANYSDPSTDGYFGRKTAIAVIGWPVTNHRIKFKEIDFKAILLEKYTKILEELIQSGFNELLKNFSLETFTNEYNKFVNYVKSVFYAYDINTGVDFTNIDDNTECNGIADEKFKKFFTTISAVIDFLTDKKPPPEYNPTDNDVIKEKNTQIQIVNKKFLSLREFSNKCATATPLVTADVAPSATAAAAGPKLGDAAFSDSDSSASGSSASRSSKKHAIGKSPIEVKPTPYDDDSDDDDGADNPLLAEIRKGTHLRKVAAGEGAAADAKAAAKKGSPPKEEEFDMMAALKKRLNARRAGVGGEEVKGKGSKEKPPSTALYIPPAMAGISSEGSESSDWGEGGGYIKKKLLRKQSYRNLNSINNKTSRKKTKLTEVFKSKKNNKKTLRKR
jgi:hypothetical protein